MRMSRAQQRDANKQRRTELLDMVIEGVAPEDAWERLGRSRSWYQAQRKENSAWAHLVDRARTGNQYKGGLAEARSAGAASFEEFCSRFLGQRLFDHQLQWLDLLEGREPRNLHPAMQYELADPRHIMINVPPDHAKSTTITVNYVTYLMCTRPNIRIVVVSKTAPMAQKFVYQVKTRLTHPRYGELQATYGPPGGFKKAADKWTNTEIYLGEASRDSGEKDPTLQGLGLGQQILGARPDIVILDDVVTISTAHQYEEHIRWLQQEVVTRPGDSGMIVVVGTRVAPLDIYKELRNPERYSEGSSPWTYFSQPAVLEFAEDPKDWVTLWPRSSEPWPGTTPDPDSDGLFPRWGGTELKRKRNIVGARTWAFCYQQQNLSDQAVFPADLVRKSVNGMRSPGLMHKGAPGYRPKGMDGLYVVGGVDPAMTGDTAMVVLGLDRFSGIRYLLDARVRTAATPIWIRETIKELVTSLRVNEMRIEKNAFQKFLVQDPEINKFCAERGCTVSEHFTGNSKWDENFGVAAMSLLFQNNLIELPSTAKSEAVRQLVEQLITWAPDAGKNAKTDLVMALWFANIKCEQIMQSHTGSEMTRGFLPNRFLTRSRRAQQFTVNVTDLAQHMEVGWA